MEEYGNLEAKTDTNSLSSKRAVKKFAEADDSMEESGPKQNSNMALMQTEERNTGAVTWTVYKKYLGFAGGMIWAPVIVLLLTLTQGAQGAFLFVAPSASVAQSSLVGSNLFLGFWTSQSIDGFKQGDYMAVYACLGMYYLAFRPECSLIQVSGVAQAVFFLLLSLSFA